MFPWSRSCLFQRKDDQRSASSVVTMVVLFKFGRLLCVLAVPLMNSVKLLIYLNALLNQALVVHPQDSLSDHFSD